MFLNQIIEKIYRYLKFHDGEIILMFEMEKDLMISQPTLRKYLKWLQERELIRKKGKRFFIIPI